MNNTMTIEELIPWTNKFWSFYSHAKSSGLYPDHEAAMRYAHGKIAEQMFSLPARQKYEILRAIEHSE